MPAPGHGTPSRGSLFLLVAALAEYFEYVANGSGEVFTILLVGEFDYIELACLGGNLVAQ